MAEAEVKKTKRSPARIAADERYYMKRRKRPRLPGFYLNDIEADLCERIFERYPGTKKSAILEGLKLLEKKIIKS